MTIFEINVDTMIIVTGAAGFIGSCLIAKLNEEGFHNIIAVDEFQDTLKVKNLENRSLRASIHRNSFIAWFGKNAKAVEFIFHLGAHTDTTDFNIEVFQKLNTQYSKDVWNICTSEKIPLVYASSAATYGDGTLGFEDDESKIPNLKPLNPYAHSKQDFDSWILKQPTQPPYWAGLKFFNVYGPNEYHKGKMASMVYQAFLQVQKTGHLKLFKSHKLEFDDGGQLRDFVYVKDVTDTMLWLMNKQQQNGIYNVGTGVAQSFNDLADAIFKTMGIEKSIEYIDIPESIRDKYQYFTQANISKLQMINCPIEFRSLKSGITDYINNHLLGTRYL